MLHSREVRLHAVDKKVVLTPREQQLCKTLANPNYPRHDNKHIADILGLTPGSVKCYISRLHIKTGLDRYGLLLLGIQLRVEEENDREKAEIETIREGSTGAAIYESVESLQGAQIFE